MDFNADNLIIVWYPRYSGGKFIMNCLALSKHCVPLDVAACNYLLEHPADYDYRLKKVLETLPAKDAMTEWLSYECDTDEFYGFASIRTGKDTIAATNTQRVFIDSQLVAFDKIHNAHTQRVIVDVDKASDRVQQRISKFDKASDKVQQRISKLIDKNLDFFAENRTSSGLMNYLSYWPNSKIVRLINFEKFLSIAFLKKTTNKTVPTMSSICGNECREKYNFLKGDDWPDWEIFEKNHYNIDKIAKCVTISDDIINEIKLFYPWHKISAPIFNVDVDNTYFDKDKFLTQMKELYSWLGYDDFNQTLLSTYYTAYIKLHTN